MVANGPLQETNREYWHAALDAIFDSGHLGTIDAVRSHLAILRKIISIDGGEDHPGRPGHYVDVRPRSEGRISPGVLCITAGRRGRDKL